MAESDALTLRMTRTLPAPPSVVWQAMTDPEQLSRWWGPQGFTSPEVDFDPEVGRSYRIAMQPPAGDLFYLSGEFKEVEPPARLAYTFVWDPATPDDRETLVELSLEPRGEQTEVRFTQGEFATQERLELHEGGWTDGFARLEDLLA
jgi:uncharacterized protein YndB with AHSA1/START domain